MCLKYCACHEKAKPGHNAASVMARKASWQTSRSDAAKCNPSQKISTLTSEHLWWTCLFNCACQGTSIFADPFQTSYAWRHVWNCYESRMFSSLLARNPLRLPRTWRLNVQKWSGHVVCLHFWLREVLCATAACTFSTAQLPRVLGTCSVFNILTCKIL